MAEIDYFLTGLNILPAGPARGTIVTSSASANTYGSWVQFIASASEDIYILGISHYAQNATTAVYYGQISIGIGSAGSEIEKAVIVNNYSATYSIGYVLNNASRLLIPFKVPSGSRVAVRAADSLASALSHYIHLHIIAVSNVVSPILTEVANPTGSVAADGSNSATTFKTDLTGTDDYWKDCYLKFTNETLINQVKKITAYNGTTHFVTTGAFTSTPVTGATFEIINQ